MTTERITPTILLFMLSACPLPDAGDSTQGSAGSESESSSGSTSTDTGDGDGDPGECPTGIEGCPCSEAESCFPGLECADEVCSPVDPCPVGSAGCPCTNSGTCDDGSVCEGSICQCTPGELGCACDNGACGSGLDCIDDECSIPELVSVAADGWGPVTCWTTRGAPWPAGPASCFAARGDVYYDVRPACEVAKGMLDAQMMPWPEWYSGLGWPGVCADGVAVPAPDAPWHQDTGCYISASGVQCMGRIGHLWVAIYPECAAAPMAEYAPWGDGDSLGCSPGPVPPPVDDIDVDEWRCGMPGNGYSGNLCMARMGSFWTIPRSSCLFDVGGALGDFEPHDGWPLFTCL